MVGTACLEAESTIDEVKMKTKYAVGSLATLTLLAVGCTDPVAPSRTLLGSNIPSFDLSTIPADPSQGIPFRPAGVQPGEVRVCKATPACDPALSWSFTVVATNEDGSAGPVVPQSPVTIQGVSGQTVCATVNGNPYVLRSGASGTTLDKITVTEVGPLPADWALTHIHVELYKDGTGYNPGNAGPNALVVTGDLTARTVTFYVNDDMQRFVTFTNDYTAPPPPPPVEICDFITFGRLVTEIGGKKVVISGNAGGNNADGSIKNEFHIEYLGVDYHVANATSYGAIASGALSGPGFPNSRVVTGIAKNGTAVELRLWDGGEPGKGTDKVWFSLNGSVKTTGADGQFIDQGNMQYHANCRGPKT
jgi:hypothetical protein